MIDVADPDPWRDGLDPETVFRHLAARNADVFWLDAGPDATAGWSFVGAGERASDAEVRGVVCASAGKTAQPFHAGWVGWTGYDLGARRAGAPAAGPEPGVPESAWVRADVLVAFDHSSGAVRWRGIGPSEISPPPSPPAAPAAASAVARHTPGEYRELIGRCRDAIREGDAYQLCLTTRFDVAGAVDPVAVHLALRRMTPSHHGGIVRVGGVALISATPERFLRACGGRVSTSPIKGTRPRGRDRTEDAALAAELRASAKEQAENVMIVDLMRNDLARVSVTGTVRVDRLLEVESYPAVHQLVSTVGGRLRAGVTVGELLDATFPAGSMTGAPKLSAMTVLHRLERAPRGVFAGCFGWVDASGALDLAMVIRSVVVHPGGAYVGAGGGITWHSDAAAEVAEVGIKATAPLAAVGAQPPPGW